MTITSWSYFVLVALGAAVYYLLPKSLQWVELLALSVVFYMFAATPYTYIYIVVSTITAWLVTNGLERYRDSHGEMGESKLWKALSAGAVAVNIILWFFLKGRPFLTALQRLFPEGWTDRGGEWTAALGMGYYTLQITGYILDCCWGNIKAQKNPAKLLLFTCFFPQLVAGPISRYSQLETLYEKHKLDYYNLAHGAQRVVWGLFKKLVISERAAIPVNCIWADLPAHGGLYAWIALLLYPIQMYTDFSGCMDIVIGTAEIFGIRLAENFNNPFFSKTSQEFWQRWHITLGSWAKDYVLYPVLKSGALVGLGKKLRKKFGKKKGKFLTTAVGMLVLWMVMGVWHGAFKYVIGVSLWYWIILMLGELTAPFLAGISERLGFRAESFGWRLFRMTRTYLIYAVGAVFFRAGEIFPEALQFIKALLASFRKKNWNPWILFDGSLWELGITGSDVVIVMISMLAVLLVGLLREKHGYARLWIDRQPVALRWGLYLLLIFSVLIFGVYGPDYDAGAFIYGQF